MVEQKGLEHVIAQLMDFSREYQKNNDYVTAALFAQQALSFHYESTMEPSVEWNNLGYSLFLDNLKIAVIRTLRELSGHDERGIDFCDMLAKALGYKPAMLRKNFITGVNAKVQEFAFGDFGSYKLIINGAMQSQYNTQIDTAMQAIGLIASDMNDENRENYRRWFSYLKSLGNCFGMILSASFPGTELGKKHTFSLEDGARIQEMIYEVCGERPNNILQLTPSE